MLEARAVTRALPAPEDRAPHLPERCCEWSSVKPRPTRNKKLGIVPKGGPGWGREIRATLTVFNEAFRASGAIFAQRVMALGGRGKGTPPHRGSPATSGGSSATVRTLFRDGCATSPRGHAFWKAARAPRGPRAFLGSAVTMPSGPAGGPKKTKKKGRFGFPASDPARLRMAIGMPMAMRASGGRSGPCEHPGGCKFPDIIRHSQFSVDTANRTRRPTRPFGRWLSRRRAPTASTKNRTGKQNQARKKGTAIHNGSGFGPLFCQRMFAGDQN